MPKKLLYVHRVLFMFYNISIMEECDLKAERNSQVCRAVDRDTACNKPLCQDKKKADLQLSLNHCFKKVDKVLSESTSQH
jgi:hypothetical protein